MNVAKIASAAERLREVRKAHEKFLAVWALECIWDQPKALDRAAADIQRLDEESESGSYRFRGAN